MGELSNWVSAVVTATGLPDPNGHSSHGSHSSKSSKSTKSSESEKDDSSWDNPKNDDED